MSTPPIQTDTLIVGAGPCGLFQVFELGLLGIKAHLIDSMPQAGGQCAELYPDKPIYDIPALPVVGAMELVERLQEQIKPFDPIYHLGEEVQQVTATDQGFDVVTSADKHFQACTIVIAGGVGSFQPRRIRIQDADKYEGKQIGYKVTNPGKFDDKDVVIMGGGDSALDWTLELQKRARSMTLIHRRPDYRAQPASVARMQALCAAGDMREFQGNTTALHEVDGRLAGLDIKRLDSDETVHIELDELLVFWGLQPKLGPIATWGLNMQRSTIEVDTEKFQTSVPGIFAVGDINTYPGKKKLILSGFHEAALAAFAIKAHISPDEKVRLQYTTTSPKMHERLGLK